MSAQSDPVAFWDAASASKRFTHPFDALRFQGQVPPSARILDYGCGQGRLCGELAQLGYTRVVGVDSSPEMIRAAQAAHPRCEFLVNDGFDLPFEPASIDVVLLFAVLTCVPESKAQQQLLAGLRRTLRPGGLLLISDYPLQEDARNLERYARFGAEPGMHGTFRLPSGLVLRHHSRDWFGQLLGGFELQHTADYDALTMNGNPARIVQFWAIKP
jgi:SAM-dependent methyltransferase